MSAASCLPKTWIDQTPGNSRTFGWFECIADSGHRKGGRASRQLDGDLITLPLTHEAASQRGVHADVVAVQIEFVRADDPVPAHDAGGVFDLHPGSEIHAF